MRETHQKVNNFDRPLVVDFINKPMVFGRNRALTENSTFLCSPVNFLKHTRFSYFGFKKNCVKLRKSNIARFYNDISQPVKENSDLTDIT